MDRVIDAIDRDEVISIYKVMGGSSSDLQGMSLAETKETVSRDFQSHAGSFLGNRVRELLGDKLGYDAVLKQTADHFSLEIEATDTRYDIERNLTVELFKRIWEKLPEDRRIDLEAKLSELAQAEGHANLAEGAEIAKMIIEGRASGFGIYLAASTVLGAVTHALGITLPFVIYTSMSRAIALALGPVGWILTGLWCFGKPDHQKVANAVLVITVLRAKYELELDIDEIRKRVKSPFSVLFGEGLSQVAIPTRTTNVETSSRPSKNPFLLPLAVALIVGALFTYFYSTETRRYFYPILMAAFIGFGTNWIAIKMLFRPRQRWPRSWRGSPIHGLIPKQKEDIARNLAEIIERDLLNADHLREEFIKGGYVEKAQKWILEKLNDTVKDDDFRENLADWLHVQIHDYLPVLSKKIEKLINEYISSKGFIQRAALKMAKKLGNLNATTIATQVRQHMADRQNFEGIVESLYQIIEKAPKKLAESDAFAKLRESLPGLIQRVLNEIPIRQIIEERIMQKDERELEEMIDEAGGRELATIQILGAALGAIAGLSLLFLESG